MKASSPSPSPSLTSAQVADYLGVKIETVYAYVSRGLLVPVRRGGRGGSLFDAAAVHEIRDGLARPARRATTAPVEVTTQITRIEGDQLFYRGQEAVALSGTWTFEEVCALLWAHPVPATGLDVEGAQRLAAVLTALPEHAGVLDVLKQAVLLAGITDPGRHDRRPEAMVAAGARVIHHLVSALEIRGAVAGDEHPGRRPGGSVATRLAAALGAPQVADVEAALVLLADHDMAVSTTALRVAVSGGADLTSALLAALATADSPWHVMAPSTVHGWLVGVLADPRGALGQALAGDAPPPGFGHRVYQRHDPRAEELLRRLRPRCPEVTMEAVDLVRTELLERRGWPMTVDLPLALWAIGDELPPDSGSAIFALARCAGWIAHALEEAEAPGMRFRLAGIYTGPR